MIYFAFPINKLQNIKNKEDLSCLQIETDIEKKKALILQESKDFEIDKVRC